MSWKIVKCILYKQITNERCDEGWFPDPFTSITGKIKCIKRKKKRLSSALSWLLHYQSKVCMQNAQIRACLVRTLVTYANIFAPDQVRENVGPDLRYKHSEYYSTSTIHVTCSWSLKEEMWCTVRNLINLEPESRPNRNRIGGESNMHGLPVGI